MRDLAEELVARLLLLDRVGLGVGGADDGNAARLELDRLARRGGGREFPLNLDAATGGDVLDLGLVVRQRGLRDHLKAPEARPVVHLDEGEAPLRIAAGADPSLDEVRGAEGGGLEDFGDACAGHVGAWPCGSLRVGDAGRGASAGGAPWARGEGQALRGAFRALRLAGTSGFAAGSSRCAATHASTIAFMSTDGSLTTPPGKAPVVAATWPRNNP